MTNYLPDQNKFKLAGPPSWWLRQLADFDPSLVVVPSRQGFYYRLAQRRPLKLTEKIVNEALFQQSDTQMLASYSLVPVTTIVATAHWDNPLMWKDLAERAPHRQGGAAKVIASLEEREWAAAQKKRQETTDKLTARAKDGWNSYQYRTGARTFVDATKRNGVLSENASSHADGRPAPLSAPRRIANATAKLGQKIILAQ